MQTITFDTSGKATTIGDSTVLEALGATTKRRASHIEPKAWILRIAFHAIRRAVRDDSHVAAWTRTWRCRWQVAIVGGPTWGSYTDRAEAITHEVAYLGGMQ